MREGANEVRPVWRCVIAPSLDRTMRTAATCLLARDFVCWLERSLLSALRDCYKSVHGASVVASRHAQNVDDDATPNEVRIGVPALISRRLPGLRPDYIGSASVFRDTRSSRNCEPGSESLEAAAGPLMSEPMPDRLAPARALSLALSVGLSHVSAVESPNVRSTRVRAFAFLSRSLRVCVSPLRSSARSSVAATPSVASSLATACDGARSSRTAASAAETELLRGGR